MDDVLVEYLFSCKEITLNINLMIKNAMCCHRSRAVARLISKTFISRTRHAVVLTFFTVWTSVLIKLRQSPWLANLVVERAQQCSCWRDFMTQLLDKS